MQPEEIHISFTDGNSMTLPKGTSVREVLKKRGQGSLKKVVAARLNGELIDLTRILSQEGTLEPVLDNDPEGLDILRHSTAHLMAQAVKELFPEVKLAIGPAIEQGFYYDFDKKEPFTPEDLPRIEEKMRSISQGNIPIVREELPREEAIRLFLLPGGIL